MLQPISKILCPTDFSDPSLEAVKSAVELAKHFDAQLLLVHIVPAIPRPVWAEQLFEDRGRYEPDLAEYEEALHTCAQQKLYEVIKQHLPSSIESRAIVVEGDAANEIVRIAEDERVSMIVISTHGMAGWRQVAFGSVAERVVRLSCRPVLTVRAPREKL
jgi:nucleotide-binding universal stress UspA family protein